MGFDDRLWIHLVEEHDAHRLGEPAPIRRSRSRRTMLVPITVTTLAAVMVAAVVVIVQPGGQSAWSGQILQRAAAAVIPPSAPNKILHITATETLSPLARRDRDSTVSSLTENAWLQQGAPWRAREIVHAAGGPVLEENSQGQIYNVTDNELYPPPQAPPGTPRYTVSRTAKPGYVRLRAKLGRRYVSTTVDAATLRSVRNGTDQVTWAIAWNGHTQSTNLLIGPSLRQLKQISAQQPSAASTSFAPELRGLLLSGHARVVRTTTTGGRAAIEISSVHPQSGPRFNYYVNPKTYAPIELETYGYDSPKDVTRLIITTYETLPLAGHRGLLRYTVPAAARVDHTPASYWHAAGLPRPF
jgi:hypothetical protein